MEFRQVLMTSLIKIEILRYARTLAKQAHGILVYQNVPLGLLVQYMRKWALSVFLVWGFGVVLKFLTLKPQIFTYKRF